MKAPDIYYNIHFVDIDASVILFAHQLIKTFRLYGLYILVFFLKKKLNKGNIYTHLPHFFNSWIISREHLNVSFLMKYLELSNNIFIRALILIACYSLILLISTPIYGMFYDLYVIHFILVSLICESYSLSACVLLSSVFVLSVH
jgi:hypothetical protein